MNLSPIFKFIGRVFVILLLSIGTQLSVELNILLDLSAVHLIVAAVVVVDFIIRWEVAEAVLCLDMGNSCISDNSTVLTLD